MYFKLILIEFCIGLILYHPMWESNPGVPGPFYDSAGALEFQTSALARCATSKWRGDDRPRFGYVVFLLNGRRLLFLIICLDGACHFFSGTILPVKFVINTASHLLPVLYCPYFEVPVKEIFPVKNDTSNG